MNYHITGTMYNSYYSSHSVANCGHPDLEMLCMIHNNCTPTIVIENNQVLPIEGSTVTFSCHPGLVLTGPSSATCAGNGEWEPDPSQLMCNKSSG